jgi:catechol 2,3-dioxygenase-like lactoylglutathione lyase family enzyme
VRLDLITIVVDDYDRAIGYFTGILGFDLVEDSPSLTNDGRPKRWVVVRPRRGIGQHDMLAGPHRLKPGGLCVPGYQDRLLRVGAGAVVDRE